MTITKWSNKFIIAQGLDWASTRSNMYNHSIRFELIWLSNCYNKKYKVLQVAVAALSWFSGFKDEVGENLIDEYDNDDSIDEFDRVGISENYNDMHDKYIF